MSGGIHKLVNNCEVYQKKFTVDYFENSICERMKLCTHYFVYMQYLIYIYICGLIF